MDEFNKDFEVQATNEENEVIDDNVTEQQNIEQESIEENVQENPNELGVVK